MTSRRVVRPLIVEFLLNHVGLPVALDQITKGMPKGTPPETVQSCMRNLISEGNLEITILARGRSWRLESPLRPDQCEPVASEETDEEFETRRKAELKFVGQRRVDHDRIELTFVGALTDGSKVVRDEAHRLYVLKPL